MINIELKEICIILFLNFLTVNSIFQLNHFQPDVNNVSWKSGVCRCSQDK